MAPQRSAKKKKRKTPFTYFFILILFIAALGAGLYQALNDEGVFKNLKVPSIKHKTDKQKSRKQEDPVSNNLSPRQADTENNEEYRAQPLINKKKEELPDKLSVSDTPQTEAPTLDKRSTEKVDVEKAKPEPQKPFNPLRQLVKAKHKPAKARIAIIIDDFGNTMKNVDDFCSLDAPLTFAVLPKLPYSARISSRARENGKEVILHVPMENYLSKNPGPGAISAGMKPEETRKIFEEDSADVPGIIGFNNHEGSKVTENEEIMAEIMKTAKSRGYFFVDSKTSLKSAGLPAASRSGVASIGRNVFLDNEHDVDYICKQLEILSQTAQNQGYAVGIGHCRSTTFQAIEKMIPKLKEDGIEFVFVSELVN